MGDHFNLPLSEFHLGFSMKKALKLSLITLSSGFLISLISFILTQNHDLSKHFNEVIPTSFLTIFKHNLKIYGLFCIPFWSILHFSYSFFIIFVSIGLSFSHLGLMQTFFKLSHLPFELFALSIPVSTLHTQGKIKHKIMLIFFGIAVLLGASLLEFYL